MEIKPFVIEKKTSQSYKRIKKKKKRKSEPLLVKKVLLPQTVTATSMHCMVMNMYIIYRLSYRLLLINLSEPDARHNTPTFSRMETTHTHITISGKFWFWGEKKIQPWLMFLVKTFSQLTPALAYKHPHSQSVLVRGAECRWQAFPQSSSHSLFHPRDVGVKLRHRLNTAKFSTLEQLHRQWKQTCALLMIPHYHSSSRPVQESIFYQVWCKGKTNITPFICGDTAWVRCRLVHALQIVAPSLQCQFKHIT